VEVPVDVTMIARDQLATLIRPLDTMPHDAVG
jgi:hypothetical protein